MSSLLSPNRYKLHLLGPWVIETTHGHPFGTWGFCTDRETREAAIEAMRKSIHADNRAYNNDTGEIIYASDVQDMTK